MDRRVCAVGMALLGGLVSASPAFAGTYDVHACSTAAGKFTNHSWSVSVPGADFTPGTCSASDPNPRMVVQSEANKTYAAGRAATLTFEAPPGATIANFRWQRQLYQFNPVDGAPAGSQMLYTLVQLGGIPLEGGGTYDGAVTSRLGSHGAWHGNGGAYDTKDGVATLNQYAEAAGYRGDATYLRFTVGCHAQPCALMTNGDAAVGSILAAVFGATVTVNDPTKPTVDRVLPTGLNAGGVVGGDEPVSFNASDNSGIRRVELVDVTPGATERVIGSNGFGCDYSYARPCSDARGQSVTADSIEPGARTLRLRVIDAGGNVGDGAPFAVQVGGALNGSNASAAARLTTTFSNRRTRTTVGFGRRARVNGRLVDSNGAPIAGAAIQVLDRQLRTGTHYALLGEVTTAADGRFSLVAGRGAARVIRFEYRVRRQLAAPTVSDTVSMHVRAGVTLSIRPRRVGPNGRIRLSGRLKAGPIPRSGKVVDLQAFDGGKWRTFETVRARRNARYSASYRFTHATRGRTLSFRARVRRDDSYPYYLGYSSRVRVRIR